jgi:hypothetical protein
MLRSILGDFLKDLRFAFLTLIVILVLIIVDVLFWLIGGPFILWWILATAILSWTVAALCVLWFSYRSH